ncbi:MAG: EamA family transporter [Dehalococcoidia bacterium]|nr:EamA family transporter [Dehalococcoidia bacterium]
MKRRDLVLIGLSGLMSGSIFLYLKVSVAEFPFMFVAMARLILGTLILLPVIHLLRAPWPRLGEIWRPLLWVTVIGLVIPAPLMALGTSYVPSGAAALTIATMPALTALMASTVAEDTHYDRRYLAFSIMLGLLGVAFLVGPEAIGTGRDYVLGIGILLVSSLTYSIGAVELKRRLKGPQATILAVLQMSLAAVIVAPLGIVSFAADPPGTLDNDLLVAIAALLALGVVGSAANFFLFTYLVMNAGPTAATYVTLISPVIAVLLGAAVLGEALDWRIAASLVLIMFSLATLMRSWQKPVVAVAAGDPQIARPARADP